MNDNPQRNMCSIAMALPISGTPIRTEFSIRFIAAGLPPVEGC
jgi:hypothetical protein